MTAPRIDLTRLIPAERPTDAGGLRVTPFAEIEEEAVTWLWPGVVPYGKLTLVIGDPGHGKSYLTVDLAARVSSGARLPDGTETAPGPVLMVFCEDGAGDTVKPRLRVHGADLALVAEAVATDGDGEERLLSLAADLAALEAKIVETGARLVVLDPLNAYLGEDVNSWKDDDVRRLLAPVARMAERTGCAVVGIMHMNKKATANVLQRATGSGAFVAVARSVFMVGAHTEDEDLPPGRQRRVFAPVKQNLAKAPPARVFRILESEDKVGRFAWEGETAVTAREMAMSELAGTAGDGEKLGQAVALLQSELAQGPRPAADLYDICERRGVSKATTRRAKTALGLVSEQRAADGSQRWTWRLPTPADEGGGRF